MNLYLSLVFLSLGLLFIGCFIISKMKIPTKKSEQKFVIKKVVKSSSYDEETIWELKYLVSYGFFKRMVFFKEYEDDGCGHSTVDVKSFYSETDAKIEAEKLSSNAIKLGKNNQETEILV